MRFNFVMEYTVLNVCRIRAESITQFYKVIGKTLLKNHFVIICLRQQIFISRRQYLKSKSTTAQMRWNEIFKTLT